MSCFSRPYVEVNYGASIDIVFVFKQPKEPSGSEPEYEFANITNDTFAILKASDPILKEAELVKVDPTKGELHIALTSTQARQLRIGKGNWFRLTRILAPGIEDTLRPFGIHVK